MLIGISLGPGDPELMTFKTAAALRNCMKVFVPGEMAAELSRPYCKPEILKFPMTENAAELEEVWQKNANTIADFAATGRTGFACIGDVNTFSTFSHLARVLRQSHPKIEIITIPGIGVVPALASRFEAALDTSFTVSDGSPVDSIIRIKAIRPRKLAEGLRQEGFEDFMLGIRLSTSQEMIIRGEMPERSDYFSVLLARRRR